MIRRRLILIVIVLLLNWIFLPVSFACKYTIREIGFTDIGAEPYLLYFFAQSNTSEEIISTFRKVAYPVLMETNVKAEIINVDEQKEHPALKFLHHWNAGSFPVAILVSSEGRSIVVPFPKTRKSTKESVWSMTESVVNSRIRGEIIKNIVRSYSIVLLIEGEDVSENKIARNKAEQAINEISGFVGSMPKPTDIIPKIIIIPNESISNENILLWSLGFDRAINNGPEIAVLYGRGRLMGPVLKNEQITKTNIFNLLSIVYADCECGLDRRWKLGTMIPFRWETKIQGELVKQLGFDVENPMIKSEMSQILSIDVSVIPRNGKLSNPLDYNLFGYDKEQGESVEEANSKQLSSAQIQNLYSSSERRPVIKIVLFSAGILVLIILVISIFILLKAKKRAS
ncbi:MAG: hypothetical protein IMY71_06580 [Bacteroidetes bacterium]|nr:hypothetical protein [Bacteroidota bacterium]